MIKSMFFSSGDCVRYVLFSVSAVVRKMDFGSDIMHLAIRSWIVRGGRRRLWRFHGCLDTRGCYGSVHR